MHPVIILKLMVLLTLANGTPVVVKKIFGRHLGQPLDGGIIFLDGRRLLGTSKTVRGILISIGVTAASAPLVGLDMKVGAIGASAAMAGDLFSSFLKRRLNLPPSSQAIGLDQVPESLLPFLAWRAALPLSITDIALGVGIFFVGELILSRILFKVGLRDEPY
jgi:CDP-diglyceride synthetase